MRPEHIVWIDSDKSPESARLAKWCMKHIGEPYKIVEYPMDGVPQGFDYTDPNGKWCCYMQNNIGDRLVDTWCFRDEKDATFFSLRWA